MDITTQVFEFEKELNEIQSESQLDRFLARRIAINHPHYYYRIAEFYYLEFSNYLKARPYLKQAIRFGFNSDNEYIDSAFVDSIGQSMLTYLENENSLEPIEQYKICCLCYSYLSLLINRYRSKVYNSCFSRALLLSNNMKKLWVKKMISDYYSKSPDLCVQLLTYGDFTQAYLGFLGANEISNAQRSLKYAKDDLVQIKSLPQFFALREVGEAEVSSLSLENSRFFSEKVLADFRKGIFNIT